jgi:hypothetical protein
MEEQAVANSLHWGGGDDSILGRQQWHVFSGGVGEVTVNSGRSGADGFWLITTARTTMADFKEDKGGVNKDDKVDKGEVL